jgi:membrane-bound serine protease (ClpP class)
VKGVTGMKTLSGVACLFLALALCATGQNVEENAGEGPYIVICPIVTEQGTMIDDGILVLVNRAISVARGAEAIIFIIDTPGGRLDSAIEITKSIMEAPCKTIAYVKGMGAISAGAIISYSCDEIVMAPASTIGASQVVQMPVMPGMGEVQPAGEKETSFLRSKIAALGEEKGHNPYLGMAMVDKDIELVAIPRGDGTFDVYATNVGQTGGKGSGAAALGEILEKIGESTQIDLGPLKEFVESLGRSDNSEPTKGEQAVQAAIESGLEGAHIVVGPDKLLTLTPDEAIKYRLAKVEYRTLDNLLRGEGLDEFRRVELELTWSEELFRWLTSPTVAGILLMLGVGGLYVEIRTPGFGLPGIVGIAALALFFGSRSVIGLSDWIDLLLVLVGLILIAIEAFVLPGFGIAGVAGILSLLAGLYLSFTFSDFSFSDYSWNVDRLQDAGKTVTLTTVGLVVMTVITWKVFPHTPLYGRLILSDAQDAAQGYSVQSDGDRTSAIGLRGVATSMLRPAGRGRFGGKTLQVVSRAEFIEDGTPITIVEVEGNRYVVDRLKEDA